MLPVNWLPYPASKRTLPNSLGMMCLLEDSLDAIDTVTCTNISVTDGPCRGMRALWLGSSQVRKKRASNLALALTTCKNLPKRFMSRYGVNATATATT